MAKVLAALVAASSAAAQVDGNMSNCTHMPFSLYSGLYSTTFLNGTKVNLNQYEGKVLMVTNVASF